MSEFGELVVENNTFLNVKEAPDKIFISLGLIRMIEGTFLYGNELTISHGHAKDGYVLYVIDGWDDERKCLTATKQRDTRREI